MINNYNEYLTLIKEGLIKSHNIEKYYTVLDIEFNSIGLDYEIEIDDKYKYRVSIINSSEIDNNKLKYIITLSNNLGYFPSYIWCTLLNGKVNSFKYDKKYLSNKYKHIMIQFESKYDDGLYSNDVSIPNIVYHLTKQKNKVNIQQKGLYPKSYNRKTKHTDRIYLFDDINDMNILLDKLKYTDNDYNKYMLLQIKLSDKNILHTDPNYYKGYYTYDNIPNKDIKIIDENL